jgi:hypothetical protein
MASVTAFGGRIMLVDTMEVANTFSPVGAEVLPRMSIFSPQVTQICADI